MGQGAELQHLGHEVHIEQAHVNSCTDVRVVVGDDHAVLEGDLVGDVGLQVATSITPWQPNENINHEMNMNDGGEPMSLHSNAMA